MLVLDLKGRPRKLPIKPYLIDWDPKREVSRPQAAVKAFLRPFWEKDVVLEEARIPTTKLRIDVFNVSRGIVVEVSPVATHGKFSPFFHVSIAGWTASLKRDLDKERWATEINKFTFIEITDSDFPLTPALFKQRWDITL